MICSRADIARKNGTVSAAVYPSGQLPSRAEEHRCVLAREEVALYWNSSGASSKEIVSVSETVSLLPAFLLLHLRVFLVCLPLIQFFHHSRRPPKVCKIHCAHCFQNLKPSELNQAVKQH